MLAQGTVTILPGNGAMPIAEMHQMEQTNSSQEDAMEPELEELLRIPQAARVLGIRPKTLRDWVWRRKVTFVKVGKSVAFRPSDLRDFIEKNVVTGFAGEQ